MENYVCPRCGSTITVTLIQHFEVSVLTCIPDQVDSQCEVECTVCSWDRDSDDTGLAEKIVALTP